MIPRHPFARLRSISRRDALRYAGAVGISAGTWVGCEAVKIAAERTVLDPLFEEPDPVPHMRMDLGPADFRRLASAEQRAALESLNLTGMIPASGRCSIITESNGELLVEHQGGEAASILWGRPLAPRVRMIDQPDRSFGRWREGCMRLAAEKRAPTFELVRAVINRKVHRYTALIVPADRLYVVTAGEAKPPHTGRSTPPTTARVPA